MAFLANGVAIPRAGTVDRRALRYKGYLLVLPAVVYVLVLIGFPLAMGIWYSLTDTTVARDGRFIGRRRLCAGNRQGQSRTVSHSPRRQSWLAKVILARVLG
jgi:ABC-type sugar transport system permease subunit